MKFKCDININLPRALVIELMIDMENRYKWQEGLIDHKYLTEKKG